MLGAIRRELVASGPVGSGRPPSEQSIERGSLQAEHCIAVDEAALVERAPGVREAVELLAERRGPGHRLDVERERIPPDAAGGVVRARLLGVHRRDGMERVEHEHPGTERR